MWSRGHKSDWNYFADEVGDPRWGYEAVLDIYRRIEDKVHCPKRVIVCSFNEGPYIPNRCAVMSNR